MGELPYIPDTAEERLAQLQRLDRTGPGWVASAALATAAEVAMVLKVALAEANVDKNPDGYTLEQILLIASLIGIPALALLWKHALTRVDQIDTEKEQLLIMGTQAPGSFRDIEVDPERADNPLPFLGQDDYRSIIKLTNHTSADLWLGNGEHTTAVLDYVEVQDGRYHPRMRVFGLEFMNHDEPTWMGVWRNFTRFIASNLGPKDPLRSSASI